MQTRFILSGIGTKGDVLPLVALGAELVRRGHSAHLLANDSFAALAQRNGLGFDAVTAEQKNNLVSSQENLEQHVFPSYEPTFEFFRAAVAQGDALVVVNLDEFSASNVMCERYGLPLCRVHLAPWRIRSVIRPPWPLSEKVEGRLRATYRKYRLPLIYRRMTNAPRFIARLNTYREAQRLPAISSTLEIDAHITRRLGFFPRWYAEPAADWPVGLEPIGFPLPRSSGTAPADFTAFVRREGRPLVFTPGTGVTNVDGFFQDALQCCNALGMPGLFLSPRFRVPSTGLTPGILHLDFLDLELALSEAALLVHHGGIGTTARAFQAAVPQIIRPVAYDQFDNGARVRALGAGDFFPKERYSLQRLIDSAKHLTSSPEVRSRLEHFKGEAAGSDAIRRAASILERSVPGSQPRLSRRDYDQSRSLT